MTEINECPKCGSKQLKKLPCGDIECAKCLSLLQRVYITKDTRILKINDDIKDYKTAIENCVYNAACIIEALEIFGYMGNGHQAAQRIAKYAVEEFLKGYFVYRKYTARVSIKESNTEKGNRS